MTRQLYDVLVDAERVLDGVLQGAWWNAKQAAHAALAKYQAARRRLEKAIAACEAAQADALAQNEEYARLHEMMRATYPAFRRFDDEIRQRREPR